MVSEIKQTPLIEMSGSASEIHVHLYIAVQCGLSSIVEDDTTISVVDCVKFSVLVNQCVRLSYSLGGSTYHKKKPKGTHHILYNFLTMRLVFVVS